MFFTLNLFLSYLPNDFLKKTILNMGFSNNTFLISSLKEGNKKAFSYLIDTYHHDLCVYTNSLINNHIQAEDIVQNVLIRIWEKRDRLNESISLKSFLYKSVYNEFIDQYRKTKSVLKIEKIYSDCLNNIVDSESEKDTQKLIILVKESIQLLPPKCKQIFELSKRDGLSNIEISEHLDISVKSVEAHVTKGYKTIRKNLKERVKSFLFILFKGQLSLK